jgi:hypothetical protein
MLIVTEYVCFVFVMCSYPLPLVSMWLDAFVRDVLWNCSCDSSV